MWFSLPLLSWPRFFPPPLSSPPSLAPSSGFLDAQQTQCSLCKITRLIKTNKQTTAIRQLQMKANLYTINRRRSSFNLPLCPGRCSPLSFFILPFSLHPLPAYSSVHPLYPPTGPSIAPPPFFSPSCVAGLGSKARETDWCIDYS